jgi:hypothetical protein
VFVDVAIMAVSLAIGNVAFRHFEPRMPLWRRLLKSFLALAITAIVSCYLGTTGVLIWFGIAALPLIYVHGYWLLRHGVNGWTGEPREKYCALRGWPPPDR